MYQSLFELLHTYIYAGEVLTSDMSLVCTLLASIGCIFVVSIPFLVVYKILSFFSSFGGWR